MGRFGLFVGVLVCTGCGGDTLLTNKVESDPTTTSETTAPSPDDSGDCTPVDWYQDADSDGAGAGEPLSACTPPSDRYTHIDGDCDDTNPDVHPGQTEVCNEIDDDCDSLVDEEGGSATYYADADRDGHGNPDASTTSCVQPPDTSTTATDCDDADSSVFPGATEVCNGRDDDCDYVVDEDVAEMPTWYADRDSDGHGDPSDSTTACTAPTGYVSSADDCNDADSAHWDDCGSTGTGSCTGTLYTWADPAPSQPELHIVSVYEANGGHGGPAGTITVDIDRPGNVVLVLSSYEPVDWTVVEQPGTTIDEVIFNGYYTQTLVGGASGATVTDYTLAGSGRYITACGYAWPSSTGGCDTPGLVTGVETLTGLDLAGFAGCYHSTGFVVR